MPTLLFRRLLALTGLCLVPLGPILSAKPLLKPDYELHEWGVFTAPRDAEWLKQDMIREWQSFPPFFHGVLPKRKVNYRGPVTKPVIFLHTKGQHDIQLWLRFATGQPLIWWPPAEFPAVGIERPFHRALAQADPVSVLGFVVKTNEGIDRREAVPEGHWLNALRAVKAAPVSVEKSYSSIVHPEGRRIAENFIYYDGLMRPPVAPKVERSKDGITVLTKVDHRCLEVFVMERTPQGKIRIGSAKEIALGRQSTAIALKEFDAPSLEPLRKDLHKQLTTAGLHEDEASSLLEVWGPGLFEKSGLSLRYRVPQETYERWLPLVCEPKPKKTVRLGLVVHQHLEPELPKRIPALIEDLGSENFRTRNQADLELRSIGGPALSAIRDATRSKNAEVAKRASAIMKDLAPQDIDLEKLMKRHDGVRSR